MTEHLTAVEIAFYPEYLNYWLCFGALDRVEKLDRRRSLALFRPGELFGYVRWFANEYGTQDWRLTIAQTPEPSVRVTRLAGVMPGAELLLLTAGKSKVKRALAMMDQLEKQGFVLEEISLAYYRHVHLRIAAERDVRPYSARQHAAHLAAMKVDR